MPAKPARTGYYAVPYLRALREQQMLTQAQLAEMADVSRATIVTAEQGERVRIHVIEKLAQALGTDKRMLAYGPAEQPERQEVSASSAR